ncbi:hypothetical protein ACP179_01710 (plasmid) [Xenorhabdus stockiae]|uniref:hypothetical protein n=1 Tax=Xenorhabdus stockiae TaxID=351614 RepID=UPI003CF899EE
MTLINILRKIYTPVALSLQLIMIPICIITIGIYLFSGDLFSMPPLIAGIIITISLLTNRLVFSKTKSKIEKIKKIIINNDFSPSSELEYLNLANGKYIGIDKENGRILTISLYDHKKPIIIGYEFYDWLGYDTQKHDLTLNFNDVNHPYFSTIDIKQFRYKLDVLLSSSFSPKIKTDGSFKDFVKQKSQLC